MRDARAARARERLGVGPERGDRGRRGPRRRRRRRPPRAGGGRARAGCSTFRRRSWPSPSRSSRTAARPSAARSTRSPRRRYNACPHCHSPRRPAPRLRPSAAPTRAARSSPPSHDRPRSRPLGRARPPWRRHGRGRRQRRRPRPGRGRRRRGDRRRAGRARPALRPGRRRSATSPPASRSSTRRSRSPRPPTPRAPRARTPTPRSSAAQAVAAGDADALVCGGSTGAALAAGAASTSSAHRGIHRPALAAADPGPGRARSRCVDVGANTEVRARAPRPVRLHGRGARAGRARRRAPARRRCSPTARRPRKGTPLVLEAHARAAGARRAGAATSSATSRARDLTDGRRRRRRHRRLHRQRRAEADGGRLADDRSARSATRRASTRARKAGGAAAAPGAARLPRRDRPRGRRAAPTCSACAGSASSPHGRFTRHGFAQAILLAARGVSGDVVGRTHARARGAPARCEVRAALSEPASTVSAVMTREEVFALIQAHLADELEVDPARIDEATRFKEDLEADSLDLYTLVQELEDSYGVKMSDEQAAQILTVGQAVDFVLAHAADREPLSPAAARRHCSTSCRRTCTGRSSRTPRGPSGARTPTRAWRSSATACSGLAVTDAPLPAPGGRALRRRAADEDPRADGVRARRAGRSPSASACPSGCAAAAPAGVGQSADALVETERVLASVIEAVIGACYLHAGYERDGGRGRRGVPAGDLEDALTHPVDFKSTLQERLAQRGEIVAYDGRRRARAAARPHLRGRRDGRRARRSAAARAAPRSTPSRRPRAWRSRRCIRTRPPTRTSCGRRRDAPEVADPQGLQVLPRPHAARVRPGRLGDRRAQRLGQVERHRRGPVGDGRAVAARRPRPVDAGRHLRRRPRRAGALGGRGRDRPRQLRRRGRPADGRDLDPAPARPHRRGRVPPQRRALPARRRARGALATPASARRCTRSSRRAASRRSSPPSRATAGC